MRRIGDQADVVGSLTLLVDEGLDDAGGELGGVGAPVAVLPEDGDDDIGINPDRPCQ